ncbi:MAG: glucan biosynthesis protein, partial [Candidatus Rokuibacteriota bacterium]
MGSLVVVFLTFLVLTVDEARAAFGLDDVAQRAKKLAASAYNEPKGQVPDWLLKVSYDQWRDIRFRPEEALWRAKKLPFQVQFFHPGLYYDRTVRMNVVEPSGVKPFRFSPSQFDYGKNDFASRVPQDLGFAGFRVHAPIKTRDYYDEVIVFLG